MGRLSRGEFGPRIKALLAQGVKIKCGNCGRDMSTDWAPKGHMIYDDGSGRCWEPDGLDSWWEVLTPDNSVSTRFGVSLGWAEYILSAQKQDPVSP